LGYRRSPEDALEFGRVPPGIAHIANGEIYRARVRARRRGGEFAGGLFFDGGGFPADEVRPGSIGDGDYYAGEGDGENMSTISHTSTCSYPIAQGLECGICMRREISVQFRECSHALCAPCAEALWKSRASLINPCPVSFPCHLCRAEIREVGKLRTRVPGFGDPCRHGKRRFTVWKWEGLWEWASGGKEDKKKKSLQSALTGLARRLGRRLANASFTNGRGSQGL